MPVTSYFFDLPKGLHERAGKDVRVTAIVGPEEAGPMPSAEEIEAVVEHALHFNKRVLSIYCLGDNIPPIVVAQGSHQSFIAAEGRDHEDDDSTHYCLKGYGFSSLGHALVFALALRDRKNPNDARSTSTAIRRLLEAPEED